MSADHDRILAFLRSQGARGATDEEMAMELGIPLNTLRPRRRELAKRRLISGGDNIHVRPTAAGALANIWKYAPDLAPAPAKKTSLAKAAAPFVAAASDTLERLGGTSPNRIVLIRVSLRDCRALVEAAGD
jgi:hypothetical protein